MYFQIVSLWRVSSATGNSDTTLSGSWLVSGEKYLAPLHGPKANEAVARKLLKNKRLRSNMARQVQEDQGRLGVYISSGHKGVGICHRGDGSGGSNGLSA
jgi:hypothetical protein